MVSYRQKDFRVDSVINEEAPNMCSDDENEQELTNTETKDKSASIGDTKQLIKNPTYSRITHASKHMT